MFDGSPSAVSTPAAAAKLVRVPAKLQADEVRLAAMRKRIAEIGDETRRLNGLRSDSMGSATDRALAALDAEKSEVVAELTPLRREVVAARAERGLQVREILAPLIAATAQRALQAALDLRAALGALDECNAELIKASAEPIFVPRMDLRLITERLGRLSGRV